MRLSFSNHHRRLEVYVHDNEQFMIAGLEKKVFDVAEKDV